MCNQIHQLFFGHPPSTSKFSLNSIRRNRIGTRLPLKYDQFFTWLVKRNQKKDQLLFAISAWIYSYNKPNGWVSTIERICISIGVVSNISVESSCKLFCLIRTDSTKCFSKSQGNFKKQECGWNNVFKIDFLLNSMIVESG